MRTAADPLAGLDLFRTLDAPSRVRVAERMTRRHLRAGEPLVRAGEGADALYIVITGRCAVYRGEGPVPVDEIGAGDTIGEIGFFAGAPRTATVTPTRDSEVLELSREDFDALARAIPALYQAALGMLARRLHAVSARAAPAPTRAGRVVMVCGAADAPLPQGLTRRLAAALEPLTEVRVISAEKALDQSGASSLDAPEIARWLHHRESTGAFLLLRAAPGHDAQARAWNALAARQADSVLIVAQGPHTERKGACESVALDAIAPEKRRLMLLEGSGPAAPWLNSRAAGSHHFVHDARGFGAVARFLAGQARGLVLGGGGALCGAHVGTIFALQEAGLDFEAFGGASAGGAIAAALAMGLDRQTVNTCVKDMFLTTKSFSKWTVPRYSLVDPATLDAKFMEHYGTDPIEDMPSLYFTIASDLSTNAPLMLDRGPLWEAVRATCSIPGILPPFIDAEGRVLIDGGVVDNLPLTPMQGLKRGPNLAITLSLPRPKRSLARYGDYPGRGRLMAETVLPWMRAEGPKPPRLAVTLSRAILLSANAGAAASFEAADVALAPPIPKSIGLLDWGQFETLEQQSYDWARRMLDTAPPEKLGLFIEGGG